MTDESDFVSLVRGRETKVENSPLVSKDAGAKFSTFSVFGGGLTVLLSSIFLHSDRHLPQGNRIQSIPGPSSLEIFENLG